MTAPVNPLTVYSSPWPGSMKTMGAARTPASAVTTPAIAKLVSTMLRTPIPISAAVSGSCAAARSARP